MASGSDKPTREGQIMRAFTWGVVVFSALFVLQGVGGGHANAAGEIHFLIKANGVENEVDHSLQDTKLTLRSSYTVNGVTINFASAGSGSPYIDLSETGEWMVLKNVKITSPSVLNEVQFTFWREFSQPPSGVATYHIQAGGLFKRGGLGANGAKVSFRGSIEELGTSLGVIQNRTLPPSIVCPVPQTLDVTTRCITTTSYTIAWNSAADASIFPLSTPTHVLKAMFWVTTVQANNDYLQFNDTATSGILIGGGPPSGGGQTLDACDTCSGIECDTCLIEGSRCTHVCPADHPANKDGGGFWCRWFNWFCGPECFSEVPNRLGPIENPGPLKEKHLPL